MRVLTLVIDRQAPTSTAGSAPTSLLTLPLGTGSLLDYLAGCIGDLPELVDRELLVVPTFAVGPNYEQRIEASTPLAVKVIPPVELAEVFSGCEQADYLLLVDAACWPVGDFDLSAVMRELEYYRAAIHMIGVGVANPRARERVERDGEGHVTRVQRFYDTAAWPEAATTGLFLSLVPTKTLGGIPIHSLPQFRSALASQGWLSHDVALELDVVDLRQTEGVLALSEHALAEAMRRAYQTGAAVERNVLVGRDCQVHPSARLLGPLVLQDRVVIEDGATIVGPTVVGSGAEIQQDSIVAQSVLAADTLVTSGTTLRHCVASGCCSASSIEAATPSEAPRLAPDTLIAYRGMGDSGATPNRALSPNRRLQLAVKRAMDVTAAVVGLVVLSPLLVGLAILIKLSSRGPVLFAHRREQVGGEEFPCLKFRTMDAGAHLQQRELYEQNEVDGPQFKLGHDPRVTRLGHWLRKTNLDELPQLINVLLGHMSLVGPRPSPFRENQICVPWRRARLSVRPGITGLWQVCRSEDRSAGDFHEWIYYDIAYVRHFSLWLDIKILLFTLLSGGRWHVRMSWLIPDDHRKAESPEQSLTT